LGKAMRRRDFIRLLGGAAIAWPLAARAQQPADRARRIGILAELGENDPEVKSRIGALLSGLQQSGWRLSQTLQIDYRWAPEDPNRLRAFAAELVALSPDIIVANGSASTAALLQVTRTVPIVFLAVVDPVGAGFVASLPRPGGNATGFMLFE
jgi:putative tryptophan/tyrosine transport system substrate-binding protein